MVTSISKSTSDELSGTGKALSELQTAGSNVNTLYDESKRIFPESGSGGKFRLRTLGDGPCAPAAAAEAAEEAVDEGDLEIGPGYKGWINLVGVSRNYMLHPQLTNQAVAVNMLCCGLISFLSCMLMNRWHDQLVWSLPRVLFYSPPGWTIGNSNILDWLNSTLLLSSSGLHIRSTIRCRVSQTPHRGRRIDIRVLYDDDLYRYRVLADPSRSWYWSGTWDGIDLFA